MARTGLKVLSESTKDTLLKDNQKKELLYKFIAK